METKNQDRPVPGHPVTVTGSGGMAMGYRVSQFRLPSVTTSTNNNAPVASRTTTRRSANKAMVMVASLLIYIILLAATFASTAVIFVASERVPYEPLVTLTSLSTTIRNVSDDRVTADFHPGFLLTNDAKGGMVFDHLAASAFGAEEGSLAAAPFELCGNSSCNTLTAWFRLNNVSFLADSWDVVNSGDDEKNKSGYSYVKFGLIANVTYMGTKGWAKRRKIPIKVRCEPVKIAFSSNANATTQSLKFRVDEDSNNCSTDGLWSKNNLVFSILGLVLSVTFLFVLLLGPCLLIAIYKHY